MGRLVDGLGFLTEIISTSSSSDEIMIVMILFNLKNK